MSREVERLAQFSDAVRGSTLKRLRAVRDDRINWRPVADALSFTDIARHLLRCDRYLIDRLNGLSVPPILVADVNIVPVRPIEYRALVDELRQSGEQRSHLIAGLSESSLDKTVRDERFDGEISFWWLIVRGCLDHEVHHRGQLAAYLRILTGGGRT
jgi:uncharacterized damage-inducible protein DinB